MLYGIEQSTDMRCPRTLVKKFTSKVSLLKWVTGGGGFTYGNPDLARNHHRSFRSAWELRGRVDKRDNIFSSFGTRDYPKNNVDNLAIYIMAYGEELGK